MTIGETVKRLITAEIYTEVRMTISDEFIHFVEEMLPEDYKYFAEKEQAFQDMVKMLKSNGIC